MPPSSPSPQRSLRAPQLIAAAALLVALVIAAVVLLGGGSGSPDAPSVREQYGGHGGAPMVKTGAVGRVALDGRWRVELDPAATGERRGFASGRFGGRAVTLPYVPNALQITGKAGERSFEGNVAWYRTTLRVPKTGRYALRFESVNHAATVWLDGQRIGGHVGTYLPFELRPALDAGREHTLVVRADWRDPEQMKATGWHRAWFNYGGINREVTIRPFDGPEVSSAAVQTQVNAGAATVQVTARLRGEGRVTGRLRRGGQSVDLRFTGGASAPVATATIRDAALWAPGRPNLYDLELDVAGKPAWRGKVGLREIRRDGNRLLLNDRPITLRGASLHEDVKGRGDGLHPADEREIVGDLVELGANATRAQHPLSPSLVEQLDARGILIWMGVGPVDAPGAWTSRGRKLVAQAKARVRASLSQLQTHPSIFAWNLANEVAGQGHPGGQAAYIDDMAQELHRRDPGRLVGLDVWGSHPPRSAGPMYADIDAIGWTNYLGWYESPHATPAELRQLIVAKLGALQQVFPDKVMLVTEFGAEGSAANPSGKPGGFGFQQRVLQTHIRTYAEQPGVTGMLIWNLRDFGVIPTFGGGSIREVVDEITLVPGLNEKGLWDYEGNPKPAVAAIKSEFAKLARR